LTVGKPLHFYPDVVALGNADGLTTEYHWDRTFPYVSSLLGMDCEQVSQLWEKDNPGIYPPSPIGYDMAVLEVLYDALSRCETLEPAEIIKQIKATDYEGLYGKVSYTDKGVCLMPCVAAQWLDTGSDIYTYEIFINGSADRPEIPTVPAVVMPTTTR